MTSEAISIDMFINVEPEEQFAYIYENYPMMKQILSSYRADLITEVIEQKISNRKFDSGELGIRIKTSKSKNSPTENLAISEIMIGKAIDEGFLDEDFFRGTCNKQELIRKVTVYHKVFRGWDAVTSELNKMPPKDRAILGAHITQKKSMDELAEELGLDYRTAVQRIWRIKKKLIKKVKPKLKEE